MPEVLNRKHYPDMPEGAVYIGRPSVFGNPYHIPGDGTREQVIEMFREYLMSEPSLLALAKEHLAGKDLVCWCAPLACHGDVLLEVVNAG